jgi:hypothetical protein
VEVVDEDVVDCSGMVGSDIGNVVWGTEEVDDTTVVDTSTVDVVTLVVVELDVVEVNSHNDRLLIVR